MKTEIIPFEDIKVGDFFKDVIHCHVEVLEINEDYLHEKRYLCNKIGRGSLCWRLAKELSIKVDKYGKPLTTKGEEK